MGQLRAVIIGAGMSGMCMAAALRAAGREDFVVLEKAAEVGGTWRENTYPGLSCDVPAPYYCFSFAPNPGWTRSFAGGAEIQRYFVGQSRELGLRDRIRFGSEVVGAAFEDGGWTVRCADGHVERGDVLVTATGVLHHPRMPDLAGLEDFAGACFHSARWDHDVPLAGRRVGVIGNGSTGVQIVGALAGTPSRLTVFQRTPQWILPVPNTRYPRLAREVLRRSPGLNRALYRLNKLSFEAFLPPAVQRPGWERRTIQAACRAHLRLAVRDPELRAKLTPDDEPMCKRLIMATAFYPAVQRDDVEVETAAIDRVVPEGIRLADGRVVELDVLVCATGFDAHAYVAPIEVTGPDGTTLAEAWGDRPRAYRTVAVPGFPNLFLLMGPHSPLGNHSLVAVAETQSAYVLAWMERLERSGSGAVAPRADATERFNADMRAAMPGTVWTTGCSSWYLDPDGVPELFPWSPERHRELLAEPVPEDFEVVGAP